MKHDCLPRASAWCRGVVVALLVLSAPAGGPARGDESDGEAGDLPVSESGMGAVAEDELAPTLESNRQPLGPDPLVLPQWTREEAAAFDNGRPVNLGGGLWSPERHPLQPAPPWPPAPASAPAPAPGVLGWELMSQYGAATDWCVDPQGVLDAARRERIESHLAAHARSAYHPVRVWLIAPGQSLAAFLDETTLHRASFGPDRPGVLVVLSPGAPMAARVLVPPVLAPRAGPWWSGVAGRVPSGAPPEAQLDQLMLWLTLQADALPILEAAAHASEWRVAPAVSAAAVRPVGSHRRWWWLAAAGLAAAAAGMAWRRRVRRNESESKERPGVWVETDRPARLGGPHSGGSGAVMEW